MNVLVELDGPIMFVAAWRPRNELPPILSFRPLPGARISLTLTRRSEFCLPVVKLARQGGFHAGRSVFVIRAKAGMTRRPAIVETYPISTQQDRKPILPLDR